MAGTKIVTRQYGPDGKGSPISFSELDTNLLYFKNLASGSPGVVPIGNITTKVVDAGAGVTITYPAYFSTTESIMSQQGGFGGTPGTMSIAGGLNITAPFTAPSISSSLVGQFSGSATITATGSLTGEFTGSFIGSGSGYFNGFVEGTASFTSITLQQVLNTGPTASNVGVYIQNGLSVIDGGSIQTRNGGFLVVNGTSSFNGDVTTNNVFLGNTKNDSHTITGSTTTFKNTITNFIGDEVNINSDGLRVGKQSTTISGSVSLSSSLQVSGTSTLNNTFVVTNENQSEFQGKVYISNISQSTLPTDGSIRTLGGLGVSKNVNIGETLAVVGVTSLSSSLQVSGSSVFNNDVTVSNTRRTILGGTLSVGGNSTISGSLQVSGATTLNNTVGVSGMVSLNAGTGSTSTTTGTLKVTGGVGISENLFVGNNLNVAGTITLTGGTAASLTVDNSSLQLDSGTTYNSSANRTISVKNLGITNAMLAGSIANAKLSNSTISGISLGSNLNTLTIGSGLSGTSYNGSSAVTISIASSAITNAMLANSSITVNGTAVSLGGTRNINLQSVCDQSGATTTDITAARFLQSSKRELKKEISTFEKDALSIIEDTKVVNFQYINDEKGTWHIGFIADDTPKELSGENQDTMDMNNAIGVLLKAVQQLNKRIKVLEAK